MSVSLCVYMYINAGCKRIYCYRQHIRCAGLKTREIETLAEKWNAFLIWYMFIYVCVFVSKALLFSNLKYIWLWFGVILSVQRKQCEIMSIVCVTWTEVNHINIYLIALIMFMFGYHGCCLCRAKSAGPWCTIFFFSFG